MLSDQEAFGVPAFACQEEAFPNPGGSIVRTGIAIFGWVSYLALPPNCCHSQTDRSDRPKVCSIARLTGTSAQLLSKSDLLTREEASTYLRVPTESTSN